ncbi:THUMP domain-containing class I SAM-dependent RNA methyltransferase [Cribrihabitans marinus]|nr:RNA methyltransferase [Cribrihabitans marinus]
MTQDLPLDLFLISIPGLESALRDEAVERGFDDAAVVPGGVTFRGTWEDAWRANLVLRGATRVLARIGGFPVFHLAQLDKRARKLPWGDVLRSDRPVKVEAVCRKSKVYHAGAARQRIETAIAEELGAPVTRDAGITVKARIDKDFCTFSVDLSGEALHRRGYKQAVGKAPLRETMAAMFLRMCGFSGDEPVLDPMCGSGSFVIEAAEIATGRASGRARRFAFEDLATFDATRWQALKESQTLRDCDLLFHGADRNAGAIENALRNAECAGVTGVTRFAVQSVSDMRRPDGPPGLIMVNPPYGTRIGDRNALRALYGTFGKTVTERFSGWRVGLVTSDAGLARSTGLRFLPPGPLIDHGGVKVRLYRTETL